MINKDLKTDFKEVLASWEYELSNKPLDTGYYSQSDIMHLFCNFLNQVWTDAKQTVQQSWGFQDEVIINMLQLMKRSLETRQKLSAMTYRLKDSGATICRSPSSISSFASDTFRPIKLASSPSTPTISISSNEPALCMHNSQSSHFLTISQKNLSCHFCHEKIGFKKSFSIDGVCMLNYHSSGEEEEEDAYSTNKRLSSLNSHRSSGSLLEPITFYYQNESDTDQDTSASKLLLADKDTMSYYYKEKLFRYHLLQRTIKDSLSMDQGSTTTKSFDTSISSFGSIEKEASEESSEHTPCLSRSTSTMYTEAHVVVSTTPESFRKSDKRKENKFAYLLKGSSSQLSLFNMKKKQRKEDKIKTSFIKRILNKK